jgi:hypothetical protein
MRLWEEQSKRVTDPVDWSCNPEQAEATKARKRRVEMERSRGAGIRIGARNAACSTSTAFGFNCNATRRQAPPWTSVGSPVHGSDQRAHAGVRIRRSRSACSGCFGCSARDGARGRQLHTRGDGRHRSAILWAVGCGLWAVGGSSVPVLEEGTRLGSKMGPFSKWLSVLFVLFCFPQFFFCYILFCFAFFSS